MAPGKTVLMVAEKPSICNSIAAALVRSPSELNTKKGSPPVHTFPGTFQGMQVTYKVTSVTGHIFSCDFPQEYQNWNSTDPYDLFDAPTTRIPQSKSVIRLLQNESKGCDFLVLWLDCDREGENICFEVIDCVKGSMGIQLNNMSKVQETKSSGGESEFSNIFRAKFSAVTPADIKKALATLGKPNRNESLSVDARQELDLKVGVAFSRFQTRYFQGRYSGLDASVVSYGPCQTPTLGFCVQRHIDIQNFQPEPFWTLDLQICKGNLSQKVKAMWTRGRTFEQTIASMFHSLAMADNCVKIQSVKVKTVKKGRPTPLNTVGLLKLASKTLGIGPFQCMQAAERLYLSGILSYPRTESTAYPNSFDIVGSLNQQASHPYWGEHASNLLNDGHTKPKGGVDMGDHPPITPCRMAHPNELHGDGARVYELVTRHFLASVSPDAQYEETKVLFLAGKKQEFTASGRKLIVPGFLEALKGYSSSSFRDDDEEGEDDDTIEGDFPAFKENEIIPFVSSLSGGEPCATINIKEGKTSPPGYLTESELISLMEKHGIGTDASIPTHINNICNRNYVTLEAGRKLVPTQLGTVLVQGYHRIDSDLVLPRVRSAIEDRCNQIAAGKADKESVVRHALKNFKNKFSYFRDSIARMEELFGSSFASIESSGQVWTRCGLTKRFMNFIQGPPARLYNRFTETVYSLPQGGTYAQGNGQTCETPGCQFELTLYSVGSPSRTYPLCPFCYNNPLPEWGTIPTPNDNNNDVDDEDRGNGKGTNKKTPRGLMLQCPHPDNHPLVKARQVSTDPDSGGVFILDAKPGSKWQFISTRGNVVLWFPKSLVKKVLLLKKTDPETESHYIQIEFNQAETPLADGKTTYVGCPANDEFIHSLLKAHEGSARKIGGRGRGQGRGRGRGGNRRGRGRGKRQ